MVVPLPRLRPFAILAAALSALATLAAVPVAACDAPACVTPTVPEPSGGSCVLTVEASGQPDRGFACQPRDLSPSPGIVTVCAYEEPSPAPTFQAGCLRTIQTGTFCAATVRPATGGPTYGVGCILPAGPAGNPVCAVGVHEGTARSHYGCVGGANGPSPVSACLVEARPSDAGTWPKAACFGPSPMYLCQVRPPVGPSCVPGPVPRGICALRVAMHDYACVDVEVQDYDHSRYCKVRVTTEREWGDSDRALLCVGQP